MHKQWEERIPFYLNRTLPPDEIQGLEAHLARCTACRQALEEWRMVADATYVAATEWGYYLPPLSATVRARMNGPRLVQPSAATESFTMVMRRARRAPASSRVTLAAVLALFVIGGIVALAARYNTDQNPASAIALLGTASATASATPDRTAVPTLVPSRTRITSTPTHTITPSFTPADTEPPTAPLPTQGDPTPEPTTITLAPSAGSYCYASSATGVDVPLWTVPGGAIVDALRAEESIRVTAYDGGEWLRLQRGGLWISRADVVTGGACDWMLQSPSASCVGIAAGLTPVSVYSRPDATSAVIVAVAPFTQLSVAAQAATDWYQVPGEGRGTDASGWVSGQDVNLLGACSALPVLADDSPGMATPAPTTPIPLPSMTPTDATSELQIETFTVSPIEGRVGDTITLTWNITGAAVVRLGLITDGGSVPNISLGDLRPQGSTTFVVPDTGLTMLEISIMAFDTVPDNHGGGPDLQTRSPFGIVP